MPNWIYNKLLVTGEKDQLQQLLDVDFSFEKIRPIPDSKKDGWYEWNLENFGCKWDHSEYEVRHVDLDDGFIEVYFETPWSPPTEILKYISKEYGVRIIDHWEEEGYQSAGHLEFDEGKISTGVGHEFIQGDFIWKKLVGDQKNGVKFV